jgi:membrane protein DedA with SNARE-associated domain
MVEFFWQLTYIKIFVLMAMESSLFPVPSEAVMIPAWYLAQKGELDILLVLIAWWVWSLFWAVVNYFVIWQYIWKPLLLKYGKYLLITEKKYHKAEKLFLKNDKLYTFLGRFIPVVRHLISIPAWIFKMNFWYFCILTLVWATLWCFVLTLVWFYFWQEMVEVFHKYTKEVSIVVLILMVIWIYKFIKWKNK